MARSVHGIHSGGVSSSQRRRPASRSSRAKPDIRKKDSLASEMLPRVSKKITPTSQSRQFAGTAPRYCAAALRGRASPLRSADGHPCGNEISVSAQERGIAFTERTRRATVDLEKAERRLSLGAKDWHVRHGLHAVLDQERRIAEPRLVAISGDTIGWPVFRAWPSDVLSDAFVVTSPTTPGFQPTPARTTRVSPSGSNSMTFARSVPRACPTNGRPQ